MQTNMKKRTTRTKNKNIGATPGVAPHFIILSKMNGPYIIRFCSNREKPNSEELGFWWRLRDSNL